ncbi:uncharacterized protein JN550_003755 [Neoarthrinium moseri]|uniref:uncharacterized protein n=1 Tax=Neoarthrinium moseri TaxID=1658444 RepID=UPI001FDE06FF|nr:uncharacterized protein JN550_003755 [Neoarthrinium moseri]KAI1872881.1 hypothetical protein JN550_003755 [Neoarthrinium moseri]
MCGLYACLIALAVVFPAVLAECNRTHLFEWAHNFVDAQALGFAGYLGGASDDFVYQENNKTMDLTAGVMRKMLKIDHNRTIADSVTCSSYTEIISADAAQPYVIGAQIHHNPSDMKAYLVDSIVSTTGSWLFNATQTLHYALQENWGVLPENKRDTRTTLKNAADAYLNIWSNKSAIDAVPWGTPCARLEGGAYTGKGEPNDSCKVGIPTNNNQAPNSHRRYVIDETVGSASVLCIFEHLQMAPDSHEFRLEGGKLRYVHTITVPQK